MIRLSIFDFVHVREGTTPADALADALRVAQRAEQLDYRRYWVAEHHNMIGISSAATSAVIGHLAAGTSKIRVGSGWIMLPNHSPLQIAEHRADELMISMPIFEHQKRLRSIELLAELSRNLA